MNQTIKKMLIFGLALFLVVGAGVLLVKNTVKAAGPKISNIQSYVTVNRVLIYWNTDVTTTSKVEYGKTSGSYTDTVNSANGSSTQHQVDISNLDYETTYYYRISATDLQGNTVQSEELTFKTSAKALRFDNITVVDTTSNKAYATTTTNKYSISNIKFGTSPDNLNMSARNLNVFSGSGLLTFNYLFENLTPKTKYYFQATASRNEFWNGETESITSDVLTFTTSDIPAINSIDPDKGPSGTEVIISGNSFGAQPEYGGGGVGFGCNPQTPAPEGNCLADLISWSDSKIIVKTNKNCKTGQITVYKFYGTQGINYDFYTIKGPTFTVPGGGQPSTNGNANIAQPATNYITNAYGCDFSTSKGDENTIKVSTLFTKDSETDKYLSQVYNAYKDNWNRAPKCSEMQFHLDHSTPIDRLISWLKNESITEKYGCKISTEVASDDTIRVKTPLTLNNDTDQYLNKVYNAYYDEWGRYPRCSEMQFHLDHSTPIDRLTSWLKENKPKVTNVNAAPAEVITKKVEFKDTGTKVELKDKSQTLKFNKDDQITFTGQTVPNAFIILTINSEEPTIGTTISDSEGKWVYTLPGPLEVGDHTVKVAVSDKDGKKVSESDPVSFSIIATAKAAETATATTEETKDNSLIYMIVAVVVALIIIFIIYLATRKKPKAPEKK